jgi:hypothetical protein
MNKAARPIGFAGLVPWGSSWRCPRPSPSAGTKPPRRAALALARFPRRSRDCRGVMALAAL